MNAYRLGVKLYLDAPFDGDLAGFVPIFHRWIQDGEQGNTPQPNDLLIHVADYSHVPDGPGVMLIGHTAHYSLDAIDGELGLLYARKRPEAGSFGERLRASWSRALAAARALEREESLAGRLRFATDRWALRIQDRLLAPPGEEAFAAVEPELRDFLAELYGDADVELCPEEEPRGCFGVRARLRQPALAATG